MSPSSDPAVSRRVRSPRGQGQQLRSEIVAAAHGLLDHAGEEAVTLRAVARQVGISAPSIYAHFADRDAILLAVAIDAFTELARHLQHAADTATGTAADQLWAVCSGYLRFARERPAQYRVMFGGVWNGARAVEAGSVTLDEVTALGAAALAVIAAALQRWHGAARTPLDDPLAAAVTVWVGLHGLAHQRLAAPGFPWPTDVEPRLVAALTGLRPPAAHPPHPAVVGACPPPTGADPHPS